MDQKKAANTLLDDGLNSINEFDWSDEEYDGSLDDV